MTWLAAAAIAALGAQPASAQSVEGVVAIVNDEVISTYDVRQRGNLIILSAGVQSTPELQQRAQSQALRELVDESLQMQEAGNFDIQVSDDQVNRRLTDIARSNQATLEAFAQQLAESGIGVSTLSRQIRADIAWNTLINGLYRNRVRISEQQVRETQERLAFNASRPHYLVSEIFLPADTPAEIAELQRGAVSLLQQMQQGASFPMVARQFSAAPSAAAGGDIGWIAAGDWPAEVEAVVSNLQPGQVSTPIAAQTGVYIVALRDRREGLPPGSTSRVSLRQIAAPAANLSALERAQRRITSCAQLEADVGAVPDAQVIDLGETTESDLSQAIRDRIANIAPGSAAPVEVSGDQASTIVVCRRTTGGGGLPSADELEDQLFERELSLLSERYLRNLRREATIITR
jgi:peptidyl-prolyl cis-trans isomerase SurA